MKLIVGLGNPGRGYAKTRHNAGFRVVDRLAARLGVSFGRRKFKGEYADALLPSEWNGPFSGDGKVKLVKPQGYMNLSGETVAAFLGYFKVEREDLLVVVDDAALRLGRLRLRRGGSAGGHNGLKDIERCLNSPAYARLRLGIGGLDAGGALKEHVLKPFSEGETEVLTEMLARAAEACLTWAGQGAEQAMNRFNAKGEE